MPKNIPERQIKIEHFQNLVAVAVADGLIEDMEKEFLAEKAILLGLPESEVRAIIDKADNLEFLIPLNSVDRETQLADGVFMAMIDGDVHGVEYDLCLRIAEKLELSKSYLDHVIELTKKLWENEDN